MRRSTGSRRRCLERAERCPPPAPLPALTKPQSREWLPWLRSVGEDVAAVLHEERVVVALVRVRRVVLGARRGSVGKILFRVDRSDRADVGLVPRRASSTRRAVPC